MKDFLAILLIGSILCSSTLMSGCAGRQAHPCQAYQPGDDKRSCESLKTEYADNEKQIKCLKKEANGTFWWNTTCFVTGFFVIVPWFLMNLKDAPKTESEALKQRNSNLTVMAGERNCDLTCDTPETAAPAAPAGK